jgi:hypothetical protein
MIQLLFHLWGDFITQNHYLANKKVEMTMEGWLACLIHCVLYAIPFAFIAPSAEAWWVIFGTHFLIDKFRLAKYVQRFRNWHWQGNGTPAPDWLGVWLMFITDNIMHVTINYLALTYLK